MNVSYQILYLITILKSLIYILSIYLKMFILLSISDRIIIKPEDLSKDFTFDYTVLNKVREKYIGKALINQGIVTSIKSLVITNNTIVEIEGVITVEYKADLIVLSPISGDILFGDIIQSNENGIIIDCKVCKVSVAPKDFPSNTTYSTFDKLWYWRLNDMVYYYDINQKVRVKVLSVIYETKGKIKETANKDKEINMIKEKKDGSEVSDFIIINGSFKQSGLGPLSWWNEK